MKLLFKILIGIALGICLALLIIFAICGVHSVILEASKAILPNPQLLEQVQSFIESIPSLVFILPIFIIVTLLILLYRNTDRVCRFVKRSIQVLQSSLKIYFLRLPTVNILYFLFLL